ncbi:MAG: M48 family peptidase [Candidatus Acidiferrales bacterium]
MSRRRANAPERHVPGGALVFQRMYTRLNCEGRPPQFEVEFYPYSNLTHSIRLRHEVAHARLSDLLRDAPLEILEAAAAILLARLYRRRLPREILIAYKQYSHGDGTRRRLLALRRKRARPRIAQPRGRHFDLGPMFDELNRKYFREGLPRPKLGWSAKRWRSQLGTYDPALDQIAINCALDRADVPQYVLAYVLYHEMLHQKHPMKLARCRLESHSREFREEEKQFREYARAMKFLARFA